MEALLDILNQKLLVSSHGYRADEFLAIIRDRETALMERLFAGDPEPFALPPERLDGYLAKPFKSLKAIEGGAVDGLAQQNPFKMGYESTRAIGLHLQGQAPPRLVDSGAALITPADLEKPEIKTLLAPGIERYLKGR